MRCWHYLYKVKLHIRLYFYLENSVQRQSWFVYCQEIILNLLLFFPNSQRPVAMFMIPLTLFIQNNLILSSSEQNINEPKELNDLTHWDTKAQTWVIIHDSIVDSQLALCYFVINVFSFFLNGHLFFGDPNQMFWFFHKKIFTAITWFIIHLQESTIFSFLCAHYHLVLNQKKCEWVSQELTLIGKWMNDLNHKKKLVLPFV